MVLVYRPRGPHQSAVHIGSFWNGLLLVSDIVEELYVRLVSLTNVCHIFSANLKGVS